MPRARKMLAMTQARNAQTLFSGSLLDHILSPVESISCNLNFRPHLCVIFMIMHHEHMALVTISVSRKVTYTSKLIELIAILLKST